MRYVYLKSEPGLWTVGFYKPTGEWEPESDHGSAEKAAKRVAWLNGAPTVSADVRRADHYPEIYHGDIDGDSDL